MKNEDRPARPTPEELAPAAETAGRLLAELDRLLLGRPELHRLVLAGLLAKGHLLLEGLPGVGKTALIVALSKLLDLEFKRVQFTPDLMPGDILGTHLLRESAAGHREMAFQPGPVFTNLLLADEINRASPKTQSALLEAMQEGAVTQLGTTRKLPRPFFVLATQNPIEQEGTYPLPGFSSIALSLDGPRPPKDLEELVAARRAASPTFTLRREPRHALRRDGPHRCRAPGPPHRAARSASHEPPEAPAVVKRGGLRCR
jgi:MoxR-like ATPase